MRYRNNYQIKMSGFRIRHQGVIVQNCAVRAVNPIIMQAQLGAILTELFSDIEYAAIANIGAVFFERYAEDQDLAHALSGE